MGHGSGNGALDAIVSLPIDLDEFTLKYNIISSQGFLQIHCHSQGVPLCGETNSASFTTYCTCILKPLKSDIIMVPLYGRPRRFFRLRLQN